MDKYQQFRETRRKYSQHINQQYLQYCEYVLDLLHFMGHCDDSGHSDDDSNCYRWLDIDTDLYFDIAIRQIDGKLIVFDNISGESRVVSSVEEIEKQWQAFCDASR